MTLQEFCQKNWYTLLDYIPSWWDRYWDWIPSVTTILSLLYDRWFEYVKRNHADAVKDAADRWTDIHSKADKFFDEWWEINHQILKFHTLHRVVVHHKELKIIKDVQWTIDLVWDVESYDWVRTMNVDYKSSKNKSEKYKVQLGGYQYLNWLPGGLLYLDKKKFIFDRVDTEVYMPIFVELKNYFLTLLRQWRLQ